MGKIIKYCAVCEESFAEKFSFCPNCTADLQTFEMNPVLSKNEFKDSIKQFEGKVISEKEFYNVTFVEEKGSKKRRSFLLGATLLVMGGAVFSLIGSIYNADAYVGALDESLVYISNISNENESIVQDLELPESRKDGDGSGGGGGGRKDKAEVSKGELPPQFKEKPLLTPSKEDISVTDPSLKVIRGTKGPNDIIPKERSKTNGMPNSTYEVASDGYSDANLGMGKDGSSGIGNRGRDGVGNDGIGGIGNNKGDKYGNRDGSSEDGDLDRDKNGDNPPQIAKGVTVALKITDKPRAIYTQDARKNQTGGTVTLRVTFMANGSIGNIAVVSGLPDGLTEQAIAAARNIQFEPAKKNGVAQTVTKQVQYTFTLY